MLQIRANETPTWIEASDGSSTEAAILIQSGAATPGRFSRWFQRRFGAAIVVELGPDELRLTARNRELRIPTRHGRTRPLFQGSALDDPTPYAQLVETLRHALPHFVSPRLPVKPAVIFRNVASLDGALGGFQGFVLERAALDAGAHHVDFDPPLPRSRGR